jgi:HEAT repeat protein
MFYFSLIFFEVLSLQFLFEQFLPVTKSGRNIEQIVRSRPMDQNLVNFSNFLFGMEEFRPDIIETLIEQCLTAKTEAGSSRTSAEQREFSFEQLARRLAVAADRLHLLDTHLARLAEPILAAFQQNEDLGLLERACRTFYLLCNVRGVAPVAKLLPHEMACVDSTLQLLARGSWAWETSFVLLVWLSELVLMPIALTRIVKDQSQLMELGKLYLRSPGKPSSAACTLLSRMVARPDCVPLLSPFLTWCLDNLDGSDTDLSLFSVLASIFSTCNRESLLDFAPGLLVRLTANGSSVGGSVLRRKTLLKLLQRIGLVFLAPRLAPWRYQRGSRLLLEGLTSSSSCAKPVDDGGASAAAAAALAKSEAAAATWAVPTQVDRVVHLLLQGLKDRDTVVRWCAAKGIGRVSERLPADFAEEVVEAVLELCSPAEEENAWHGSCLAVAELARRGLLLPQRLSHALPAVLEALRYDAKHGARSVGSQVRDAACYVLWACARAYAPEVLSPFSVTIASGLLECAALDRELNCRRAASAAIQEHVGRVGLMPHGLELVSVADYFKLGSLKSSYLEVGLAVSAMPEYETNKKFFFLNLFFDQQIRSLDG